jgi:hypothetical protein
MEVKGMDEATIIRQARERHGIGVEDTEQMRALVRYVRMIGYSEGARGDCGIGLNLSVSGIVRAILHYDYSVYTESERRDIAVVMESKSTELLGG